MKLVIAFILSVASATALSAGDYQCGMYRVSVVSDHAMSVDGRAPLEYQGAILDQYYNFLHQYGEVDNRVELRETPKGRIAFRVPGKSRWAACVPVVFGFGG